MIVVAGPPGGGKSTVFPVNSFGVEAFNADDRAAYLNNGSYRGIPPSVRSAVNKEFEAFVEDHIGALRSFAFETTLRTDVTLRQAALAKANGFTVAMNYLAMGSLEDHLERVAARAEGGGHAASSSTLGRIYHASLKNLPPAIRSFDAVRVFDNSAFAQRPRLVLECQQAKVWHIANELPDWLSQALRETEYEITPALRAEVKDRVSEQDRSDFDR
ncbi:MAG TPA: hypothetical protein VGL53_15640 [Bryobacteraceae bacterium]|jgi:predicted ABC-type ATPase